MTGIDFYKRLKTLRLPVTQALDPAYFSELPADWHVIVSDVKNSTAAVIAGRHNDVNLVAAGSLIVGLNIAREHNIEIPFFFGGDGGTLIVPDGIHTQVLAGLKLHNTNTINNFGLEMHIGSMPVSMILQAGHSMRIAKIIHGSFNKALVIGDGLQYAEKMIKQALLKEEEVIPDTDQLNLNGLECRWDRIKPPVEMNEVVCYLVQACDPAKQFEVFKKVLGKADEIYGVEEARSPLSIERLKLLLSFNKLKKVERADHCRIVTHNIWKRR